MIAGQRVVRIGVAVVAGCLWAASTFAQTYAAPFPREGATKVHEDDRVIVWDVTRDLHKPTPMARLPLDQVSVTLAEGAVRRTGPDGTAIIEQERFGSVRFASKGTVSAEEGVGGGPSRVIVFQLKGVASPRWPVTEGVPGQFPRVSTVKLFETDRINVWDQTWVPGQRIARHLHYAQTAAVFLVGGKLRTIDEGRQPNAPFSRAPGEVLGAASGPIAVAHEEEQVEGSPRAIWIEFK